MTTTSQDPGAGEQEYEAARRFHDSIDGTAWTKAALDRSAVPPFDARLFDPGSIVVDAIGEKAAGLLVPDAADGSQLPAAELPKGASGSGIVGSLVHVELKEDADAVLVLPLREEQIGRVAVGTVRLFRWDDEDGAWQLVRYSAPGLGGYVWGRISAGGTYAAIGLPRDPVTLLAVRVVHVLRGVLAASGPDLARQLVNDVTKSLLSNLAGAKQTPGLVAGLLGAHATDGTLTVGFDAELDAVETDAVVQELTGWRYDVPPPALQLLDAMRHEGGLE